MPRTKQKANYNNVKIPDNIFNGIQQLIDNASDTFYYRSPGEFIIDSARLRLEEFEKKIKEEKFPKRKK